MVGDSACLRAQPLSAVIAKSFKETARWFRNTKYILFFYDTKYIYRTASPFSRVQTNTLHRFVKPPSDTLLK